MAIEAIQHTLSYLTTGVRKNGVRLIMEQNNTLNLLKSIGFDIIKCGGDGTINLNTIKDVKQFHPAKQYGLTNQYEVLCKKN